MYGGACDQFASYRAGTEARSIAWLAVHWTGVLIAFLVERSEGDYLVGTGISAELTLALIDPIVPCSAE